MHLLLHSAGRLHDVRIDEFEFFSPIKLLFVCNRCGFFVYDPSLYTLFSSSTVRYLMDIVLGLCTGDFGS